MIQFLHTLRSRLTTVLLTGLVATTTILLLASPVLATGIYDLPIISTGDDTWAIDDGNVLSRITEANLTAASQELQAQTGIEVRYVTIRRLDYGETINSFTDTLFISWFPTPEAQANQVVVALDTVTNNAAVRVGETAKAILNSEIAESVASATMMAPLIDGDKYNQAFGDAKERLVSVLSGQGDPGAPSLTQDIDIDRNFATAEETEASRSNTTTIVVVLLILATVIPMVTYYVLYQ
ncbi:MAG: YgcG family protein [Coleofasciculaceae cyanobacterium RL_1_1]|nr:YgcG family protein [Coleofasciculaceae cyanobacterium RL_1_1]